MSIRRSVVFAALFFTACSSSTQEPPRDASVVHPTTEAAVDPAARIEEAAMHEDASRTDVHAHVVSRDEKDKSAIVEVSWNERAPNDVEALDDANMHVVRRFVVRGNDIEAIAPKPWKVTDTLVACVDGRSDLLSGESAGDDCIVVPRGAHVEATGESILVPVPGPIPASLAYRVHVPGDTNAYWTVPAIACPRQVEFDDGTTGRGIGTCSAIGDEEPTLFVD